MIKKLMVSALVLVTALTAGAFVTGITSADDGYSPLFNTKTGVEGIGDEKDFLRIYDGANLVNTKEVCSGEAKMWIYVHNDRPSQNNNDPNKPGDYDGIAVAQNTRVKLSLPGTYTNSTTATAKITADNAVNSPTDTATITCGGKKVKVEYVAVEEVKSNPAGSYTLTGDITSANGASLNYKGNAGMVPGCWEYRASIVVKVKITPEPEQPKPQTLKCDAIAVNREGLGVGVAVNGSTTNGATITGYRIEFNGDEKVVNEQTAQYLFTEYNKTNTIRGYVIGTVDGKPNQKVTSNACYYEFKEDKPTEPKPESIMCDALKVDILDTKTRKVSATVTGSAQNTTITGYSLDFGDGSSVVNEQTAEHTYGKDGKYVITGTVSGTVDGKPVSDSDGCVQEVEFKEPPKPEEQALICEDLNVDLIDFDKKYVKVSVTGSAQNTTIDGYSVNFGDGSNPVNEQTAEHTYSDYGTYKIVASVSGQVDGEKVTDTNANCEESVTFTEPVEPEKPEPPVPPTPEVPTTPELPNTGAGALVGLFGGASLLGAIGHRFWTVRRLQ